MYPKHGERQLREIVQHSFLGININLKNCRIKMFHVMCDLLKMSDCLNEQGDLELFDPGEPFLVFSQRFYKSMTRNIND